MSKRLIGYARVSTPEQSLAAQVDALTVAGCAAIYGDHGVSGATASRPELDRCLADLRPGDVLVVAALDRLGRTTAHLFSTVESLAARGIGFLSLRENIDTITATGRLVLGVFAALASFERDIGRERTRAALAAKQRRGERIGRRPALTPSQVNAARRMLEAGDPPGHVARVLKCGRSTLYRALARENQHAA